MDERKPNKKGSFKVKAIDPSITWKQEIRQLGYKHEYNEKIWYTVQLEHEIFYEFCEKKQNKLNAVSGN